MTLTTMVGGVVGGHNNIKDFRSTVRTKIP